MRPVFPIAVLSLLAPACAGARHAASPLAAPPPHVATHAAPETAELLPLADERMPAARDVRLFAPGDFVVYKFTGSFRSHPMSLIERVVAQDGDATTLDFALDDGELMRTLRVRMAGSPAEPRVVSAAWVDGNVEGPVPVSTFDDLLAKTILAPERNDGLVDSEPATVQVAGKAVACHRNTYRVVVHGRKATMTTYTNDGFRWGDLGGEVRAANGKVLYHAEVVNQGHAETKAAMLER